MNLTVAIIQTLEGGVSYHETFPGSVFVKPQGRVL